MNLKGCFESKHPFLIGEEDIVDIILGKGIFSKDLTYFKRNDNKVCRRFEPNKWSYYNYCFTLIKEYTIKKNKRNVIPFVTT